MADFAFHDELQRIAGNPLVEKISFVVERIARDSREKATERFPPTASWTNAQAAPEPLRGGGQPGQGAGGRRDERPLRYWKDVFDRTGQEE
jgi:hypothetical protein